MLTSQQELAIWQPAWPTEKRGVSSADRREWVCLREGEARAGGASPFKLMTSLMLVTALRQQSELVVLVLRRQEGARVMCLGGETAICR